MPDETDAQTPDFNSLTAENFAALIAEANDQQLAEVMTGPQRDAALREIFTRMSEHFDPSRSQGDAVVHFQILGAPDGGYDEFEIVIEDGKCHVSESPDKEPRVALKVEPVSFLKLITNQQSGPELFLKGKLKIDGDLMFAPQIASMFRIPTAPPKEAST